MSLQVPDDGQMSEKKSLGLNKSSPTIFILDLRQRQAARKNCDGGGGVFFAGGLSVP